MKRLASIFFGLAALALSAGASAQTSAYPSKPIRIMVPYAVGGIADNIARVIGQKLTDAWGQPVVIENRAGAGGNIGTSIVAGSVPDGYTLVMGNIGTHAVNQYLVKNMPFDPIKDFVPIVHVLDLEGLLVVNSSDSIKTVAELIALARSQPGKLTYASAGLGTTSHLAGELFKSMAKVDLAHVPYKGNQPAIADLVGGLTNLAFATMPTVLPRVKEGRLRAIAVIGTSRTQALPDVPTVGETLPGFAVSNWIGLFAPAGTPAEIGAKIHAEVQRIMQTPEVAKRLEPEGAKFIPMSSEAFAQFQKNEAMKWSKVIRDAGIQAQ